MAIPSISPRALDELRASGKAVNLVDVRTPVEYREVHVAFARNIPLDRLNAATFQRDERLLPGEPLYLICRSGSRGKQACEKLAAAGLVFAGITDTCGMGMLLARMPWNQLRDSDDCCATKKVCP